MKSKCLSYLNKFVTLNIPYKLSKLSTCIHEVQMQGHLSKDLDLGSTF